MSTSNKSIKSATSANAASHKCAAGTLRRATRSISRVYDARLAPSGLTATQFSILRAIERRDGPVPLTELADELVFERTSLYRSLDPLAREGLIVISNVDRRARQVALSVKGKRRIAKTLPLWESAQQDFLDRFGRTTWNQLAAQLVDIVDIARAMPGASA